MNADTASTAEPPPARLTVDLVQRLVAEVAAIARDDEAAHAAEDKLWMLTLHAVAHGAADDPAAVAREALRTQQIEFSRCCA